MNKRQGRLLELMARSRADLAVFEQSGEASQPRKRYRPTSLDACRTYGRTLESGGDVPLRLLRLALGSEHAEGLDERLQFNRAMREQHRRARVDLRPYTKHLAIADLLNGRAEAIGKGRTARLLIHKAEARYDLAFEALEELLALDPSLGTSLEPSMYTGQEVPRLRPIAVPTRQIKIDVIRAVLESTKCNTAL